MIKTILVALDDSIRARAVFDTACELARALHARLVLFQGVFAEPDLTLANAPRDEELLTAKLGRDAFASLEAHRARAPDIDCEIHVELIAQAWRSIVGIADQTRSDLIVIGNHGYRGWDRLLGTTADTVVNVAKRDVLVVHDPIHAAGIKHGGQP